MYERKLRVRIKDGWLVATPSPDPDYPGIDVEFVADDDCGQNLSRPRVLMEQSVQDNPTGNIRALVWGRKDSEDYTDEVVFE